MIMNTILLKNAKVVLPEAEAQVSIFISDGVIAEIFSENKDCPADLSFDASNLRIFAGFIDIHNHGAVGFDVNEAEKDDLIAIGKFLALNGVTAWLPTFVPDTDENYLKVVGEINEVLEIQADLPIAQIVGVHYEGVFANEKMCGALRPAYFKTFKNKSEISELPKLENGVHFTTLAPEIENGIELIAELVKQNWIVSIGHTKAEVETLERAKKAGAKHLTHFFNAMTGVHHRETGVAGWGLNAKDVTFDIIADGVHVAPEMLKLVCEIKSPEMVSLISDSVAPTGLGDGSFEIWGEKISVIEGKTKNERGSIAGSVITLRDAVKNMLSLGFTNAEVSQMASANSAKLLGIENNYGTIEVGKRADLAAIDENENVKFVIINGKLIQN